jgi:hypothetical protein
MLKLTSERDLVQSLIAQSLGEHFFKFVINTEEEGNLLLEFYTQQYKFTLYRVVDEDNGDKLRIYDNGRLYLIPIFNDLEDMKTLFVEYVKSFARDLEEFYITEEKKEKEGTVIIWLKRE